MKHLRIVLWVFLFLFPGAGQTLCAQDADALVSELPLDSLLKRMGWKSVIDSLEVRRLESRLNKKKKAKNSDAGMFFTLYICYNLGLGTPIDKEKAFGYCRKSAELGYGLAQNDLGYYYESGERIPPDDSLALHYYRLAAEQKLPEALYNLGRMSLDGGCAQLRDTARAVACLQEAAQMSYPPALLRLGGYYFQDTVPDYPRAASYFRKAAEWGCGKSAHCLALMYLEGLGVAADTLQAAYWCALSADLGAEPAQYLLAGLYYTGMGIGVDYAKAAYYYSLLAEKGDCESQYWLGFSLLKQGKCEESTHWFLRAAEQEHLEAQKYLAHGYNKGACGLEKDWEQSLYWGERAAKLGDLQFLYNVGAYYLKSDKDSLRKQGEYYLLCAVDADDARAQYRLGHYYVRKSDSLFRKGVEYLILAVQKGHVEARIEFGQLCAGGYGYPRKGWEESLQTLLPRAAKGDVNAIHSVAGHYCASLDFETARYWFSKLAYRSAKLERLLKCLPRKRISRISD